MNFTIMESKGNDGALEDFKIKMEATLLLVRNDILIMMNPRSRNKKKGLTDKQKKCIAIGAAAVAASLVVYGGYKISNSRSFDRTIGMGRDFYRQGSKSEATKGLNDLVYATFKKSDAEKYKKMIPDGVGYKIKSSRKTKIAGIKKI